MKVKSIERQGKDIYLVTLVPNFFERIFGVKETTRKFKDSGATFMFGSGTVYIREDGKKMGNGDYIPVKIDRWRNAF